MTSKKLRKRKHEVELEKSWTSFKECIMETFKRICGIARDRKYKYEKGGNARSN